MNKILSWFCYIFLKPIVKLIWIKEVRGIENIPKRNFILASNHQSHLDQITNAYLCVPRAFTYLGQVDKYEGIEKILRNFFYLIGGVIPVNRYDEESKKKAMEECQKRLNKGEIVIIYPEGTRTKNGEIGEFKKGIAKLHLKSGVPVLPVATKGNFELMPVGKRFPKLKRIVRINIGKLLDFKKEREMAKNLKEDSLEYKELLEKITQKLREEILSLFNQIQ
jgi:1-acyl-sn-glycerol-3-phosphate acyltransferase